MLHKDSPFIVNESDDLISSEAKVTQSNGVLMVCRMDKPATVF
jgi:hypothetical protein